MNIESQGNRRDFIKAAAWTGAAAFAGCATGRDGVNAEAVRSTRMEPPELQARKRKALESAKEPMRGLEVVRDAGYKFMFIEEKIDW